MAKKKKSAKATEPEVAASEKGSEPARESEALVLVPVEGVEDPLGEPADGEGKVFLGDEAALESDNSIAEDEPEATEVAAEIEEVDEEAAEEPQAPAKLERLQKILSQAGIASRRRAEELITEGRVQVNGTVVTELGTKADPARDHIRVDGKLLHGAERHRYFVLNKPKGFVTTVSDPEGRPTVMTFFEKMRERLYPVGRLDYMSEGMLLVTNDGELANLLTKAGSGVEKTYLVKVAGQPTEDELDKLRGGIAIDREGPGSGKVHTAPARIRQVRQGDNPWYEVVLIEGRNRELRKMFSSIGHFVEKIRRVGYGPLVLDVEPGKLRELEPDELAKLRLAAEGKWHAPKPKEPKPREFARRDSGKQEFPRKSKPRFEERRPQGRFERNDRSERSGDRRGGEFRPKNTFGGDRQSRGGRSEQNEFRPRRSFGAAKPSFHSDRAERGESRQRSEGGESRSTGRFGNRNFTGRSGSGRSDYQKSGDQRRGERPFSSDARRDRGGRTNARGHSDFKGRSASGRDRREFEGNRFEKPRTAKPPRQEFNKPVRSREWESEERQQRRTDRSERPKFGERGAKPRGGSRPGAPRPGGRPFKPGSRPTGRPRNEGSGQTQSRSESRPQSRGFSKPGEKRGGFQNRGGGGARRGDPRPGGSRGGPRPGGSRGGGKRRP